MINTSSDSLMLNELKVVGDLNRLIVTTGSLYSYDDVKTKERKEEGERENKEKKEEEKRTLLRKERFLSPLSRWSEW
ncbi:unnamed protein product [Arctia plantaginis]|uniref:Uncharacterized protein n=1 Tax=Arctia plantaginis TaxID=874455 RepID=A0A8S1AGI5_ARCPL|nr:unnamed protein product [Arctia plantaginis]